MKFSFFKRNKPSQQSAEIQHLQAEIQHLRSAVGDILTGFESLMDDRERSGNPYPTYDAQVAALSEKYQGCAKWGNMLTQNIVDVRACFIMGQGVRPAIREGHEGQAELEFINSFLRYNNIDRETAGKWATEAEIEGKWLVSLTPKTLDALEQDSKGPNADKMVQTTFICYSDHDYKVNTKPDDYTEIVDVTYKVAKTGAEVKLLPPDFVYARFGGRLTRINETPPKLGKVLPQIENLDRALWDWRRTNELFASPTPHFKCATEEEVQQVTSQLTKADWKIGKAIATTAEFELKGMSDTGAQSLEKEMTLLVKMISGASSVPVHFLGLPDLLSNRSTADNLTELVTIGTNDERQTWTGAYDELFSKVLALANKAFGTNFDVNAITAVLPQVSSQKMKELVEVWLPLYVAGTLTLKTFLGKVPDVDVDTEAEGIQEEKDAAAQQAMDMLPPTKFDTGLPGTKSKGTDKGTDPAAKGTK